MSTVFNVKGCWCTKAAIIIDMWVRNSKLIQIVVYRTNIKEKKERGVRVNLQKHHSDLA